MRLADGTPESPGTRAELGYYAAPKARGKGYMTEALRAVLGYAFDPLGLGLETVRWTALAGNEASERVAVKAVSPASMTILTRTPAVPMRTATRCNTGCAAPI